jgi:hypothetical protein
LGIVEGYVFYPSTARHAQVQKECAQGLELGFYREGKGEERPTTGEERGH